MEICRFDSQRGDQTEAQLCKASLATKYGKVQ